MAMIATDHGDRAMRSLTEMKKEKILGWSSGSLLVDWVISPKSGGMNRGQVIEFWGPYSSGKTTVALGLCANVTANGLHVLYADLEGSLLPESIINAGVDPEYFQVTQIPDGRELTKILATLMKTGDVGLLVIDSLPFFEPIIEPKKGEDEADPTKPKIAFAASFQTTALKYLGAIAREHNITVVLINQIRKNLSGYGGGNIPYGGAAKDHLVSVRLRFSGKATNSTDKITDSEGNLIGQYTTVIGDKNKTSVPMQEARVPLILGRGVDPYMEVALVSQQVGIVDGGGGRFKWSDSGEPIAHGISAFTKKLYEDKELYMSLRARCIEGLNINYDKSLRIVNSFHNEKGEINDSIKVDPSKIQLVEDEE